jgi:hypothetical protein
MTTSSGRICDGTRTPILGICLSIKEEIDDNFQVFTSMTWYRRLSAIATTNGTKRSAQLKAEGKMGNVWLAYGRMDRGNNLARCSGVGDLLGLVHAGDRAYYW